MHELFQEAKWKLFYRILRHLEQVYSTEYTLFTHMCYTIQDTEFLRNRKLEVRDWKSPLNFISFWTSFCKKSAMNIAATIITYFAPKIIVLSTLVSYQSTILSTFVLTRQFIYYNIRTFSANLLVISLISVHIFRYICWY